MALTDFALPGIVMVLKFLLKLTIDREASGTDLAKAVIAFPVDIGFLSITYGCAILYSLQGQPTSTALIKTLVGIVFAGIIFLIPIIVLTKRSDNAFVIEKVWRTIALSVVSYGLALTLTFLSVSIRELF